MLENLTSIIHGLVKSDKEGEYWDFKEARGESLDLIHDIICLANNPHHIGRRYLIYGVKENAEDNREKPKYEIIGIQKGTIKQADIICTLRNAEFSNGNFPEIKIEEITISGKNLSVIIIEDQPNLRPYTLGKLYIQNQKKLFPGTIYTRVQDTNTPKDKTASLADCEKIWKQRFCIDKPVFERFKAFLLEPENWFHNPGNSYISSSGEAVIHHNFPLYHKIFPEFQIDLSESQQRAGETFCWLYIKPESYWGDVHFKYHNTILAKIQYVYCDGHQIFIPAPNTYNLYKNYWEKPSHFYYIIRDSLEGFFLNFLKGYEVVSENKGILIFENKLELETFVSKARNEFNSENLESINSIANKHDIVKNNNILQEILKFQLNLRKFYDEANWRD